MKRRRVHKSGHDIPNLGMYGIKIRSQAPANGYEQAALKDFHYRMQIRDKELEEMIAMGWGQVEGPEIPADWRVRRGPGK